MAVKGGWGGRDQLLSSIHGSAQEPQAGKADPHGVVMTTKASAGRQCLELSSCAGNAGALGIVCRRQRLQSAWFGCSSPWRVRSHMHLLQLL